MTRRRSQDELDRLAVEAVRLRREEGLSVRDIHEELQRRGEQVGSQRDVRFLLDRAIKQQLVNIQVTPIPVHPELDDGLARDLAKATKIRRVLVVKCNLAGGEEQSAAGAIAGEQVMPDTALLESLGAAAAICLAEVLRDDDKIAVGAGRAVSSTIKALTDMTHGLAVDGLSVTSLGGGMLRTPFTPPDGIDLVDADYNAAQMAIALGVPVAKVKLCYLPAFAPADRCDELVDLLAAHLRHLDANVLLYGCGVVDESHYLLRMDDPQMQVIRSQAEQLRKLVQRHRGAVIDFCDEFFVAPGVPDDLLDEVSDIVMALRKAAVRIDPAELARPPERILVAGGRRKIEALALLTNSAWTGVRPTTLVTDRSTAKTLVAPRSPQRCIPR